MSDTLDTLKGAVCPILSAYKDSTTLRHEGSGLLIRLLSQEIVVLTAAHVIKANDQNLVACFLAIYAGEKYYVNKLMKNTYPVGEHDLVFGRVMNYEGLNRLKQFKPLEFGDLYNEAAPEADAVPLLIYGFPAEKHVAYPDGATHTYSAPLIELNPGIRKDPNRSTRSLVNFDYLKAGFRPSGMSGSPIWKKKGVDSVSFLGIILRWDEKDACIQFVGKDEFIKNIQYMPAMIEALNLIDPHSNSLDIESAMTKPKKYESAFGIVED